MAVPVQHNNRPLSEALQITTGSNDWTVLVQCLYKSKQKISQNGSDYKNFLFSDMKGTLIGAVTYDRAIAKFSRILQPYKRYFISNAGVRDADPRYQVGDYAYTWTLYGRTPVDPFNEPIPTDLPCQFNFIKFEDMYKYADSETPVAFRALVVSSNLVPDATNDSVWDYIVINNECTRNAEEIKKLVDTEAYLDISRLLPPPSNEIIVPVRDFELNQSMVKVGWVSATIHLLHAQEKLWYPTGHNCGKSFEAPIGWNTTCTGCSKSTQIQPRCHIGIFLNDETGTLTATLFSPDAEKLTKFTGAEIQEAAARNAPLNDEIERRINKKPVIYFVKQLEKTFRGNA